MFSRSSVTVTTPSAMARILLFICFAQLIVTSVNTVDAVELEKNQIRQDISPRATCEANRLCKISGGRCQHESEQCDGSLWSGNSYCKGKGCTCCANIAIANGVLKCTTTKQWTTALTTCLAKIISFSCIRSIKACIAKIVACVLGKCFTV